MIVNNELEIIQNEEEQPNLKYFRVVWLEGQENTTKDFGQDNLSPGQNLNPYPRNMKQKCSSLDSNVRWNAVVLLSTYLWGWQC
jgi:hypothetical protein